MLAVYTPHYDLTRGVLFGVACPNVYLHDLPWSLRNAPEFLADVSTLPVQEMAQNATPMVPPLREASHHYNQQFYKWLRAAHSMFKQNIVVVFAIATFACLCSELSNWKWHTSCELENICSDASDEIQEDCDDLNGILAVLFKLYSIAVACQLTKIVLNLQLDYVYWHKAEFKQIHKTTTVQLVREGWNMISDLPTAVALILRCAVLPVKAVFYDASMPKLPKGFLFVIVFLLCGTLAVVVDAAKLRATVKKSENTRI